MARTLNRPIPCTIAKQGHCLIQSRDGEVCKTLCHIMDVGGALSPQTRKEALSVTLGISDIASQRLPHFRFRETTGISGTSTATS